MNAPLRIVIFAGLALLAACTSSPGTIVGALPDTSFVRSAERHYLFSRERGWLVAGLDGRIHRRLFAVKFGMVDISDDGGVFVLTNSATDLFIVTDRGRTIRAVPFFHRRLGAAGISPDGRQLAATRHADYAKPQKDWVEDETIYVIDTGTLKMRKAGRYRNNNGRGAAGVDWLDARRLRIMVFGDDLLIADTRGGAQRRVRQEDDPLPGTARRKAERAGHRDCGASLQRRGWRGDGGLDLVRKGSPPRRLVAILGRSRGYHDHGSTISGALFSRDCRYVTFNFESQVRVVEIATGKVGPMMAGRNWIYRSWHPTGLN